MVRITPDDLDQVEIKERSNFEQLDILQLIKLHYQAHSAINKSEVYSTRDMELRSRTEELLNQNEISYNLYFPQYYVPEEKLPDDFDN